MTSAEIRQSFLDFFKSKEHSIVPSSSLRPDSPNLLFTNAGMNQFVPIFLGERKADVSKWANAIPRLDTRAADTQKCIRAGGKHNDLEDVGLDTYHHTFFEMLGNWSFGDYFKQEAIDWAWELITEVWKFPKNRLYATVYNPDPSKGDPSDFDQKAWDVWAGHFRTAGLDPNIHIVNGNKKDNFWMMGDTGPCGPCSELHVDLTPAGDTEGALVNKGDARCIEIWNLVFIQFNANPDGTFSPLPARHVDTGMGFERVTSIIQCTKNFTDFEQAQISNYNTDIFRPIFDEIENLSGKKYTATLPGNVSGSSNEVPRSAGVPPAPVGVPPTVSAIPAAIYHERRLPHFERPWAKYIVTFSTRERQTLSTAAREIVLKSIQFGHQHERYQLFAACVMPDHVHMLFEPQIKERDKDGQPVFWTLTEILQAIKSFTAHEINKVEEKTGPVWENESFDTMIRGDADLTEKFHYVCDNPWKENLVSAEENYPWLWTPGVDLAARDAQQCDRDGRAPRTAPHATAPSKEQIQIDVAFRVIADHIRTLSFAIADGILPGNNDRNYVLRRILRRAVRYGRTLGFHEPFFYKLVDILAEKMGGVFPEIRTKKQNVKDVLKLEEESFNKTLDKGIQIFEYNTLPIQAHQPNQPVSHEILKDIPGNIAFELYDTYGFPFDLTELMARERGMKVDLAGFEKLMEEQRSRARAAQKKQVIELSQIETKIPTHFLGFDHWHIGADVQEVASIKDKTIVVLNNSVCYAEMGGQVGDMGELTTSDKRWRILNTQKSGNTWLHFIEGAEAPAIGQHVMVHLDHARRNAIQRHHTVTHLLHWALHKVVSAEASQKGSYVGPEKLTFDFNSAPLTPQQVADIEELVNKRILENERVVWGDFSFADVKSRPDVMQFFGDKYGDLVRVVQIGGKADAHNKPLLDGYSMELCGGTHVRATGEIGLFKILHESAIAAGVRRIEAVAGQVAYEAVRAHEATLAALGGKLAASPAELEKKLDALLLQQQELERQLKSYQQKNAAALADELAAKAVAKGALHFVAALADMPAGELRGLGVQVAKKIGPGVVVIGSAAEGKASVVALCSPEAIAAGHAAGKIVGDLCGKLGGKGGGKPDFAQGGGKDPGQLGNLLKEFLAQAGQ